MRRICAAVVLVGIASVALADGKFFTSEAYPAEPKIPAQRALITYRNGVESLVVASAVDSESPDLGWVIPLPNEPLELAKADPGLLTSAAFCLRPKLTNDYHWAVRRAQVALFFAVLVMVLVVRGGRSRTATVAVVFYVVFAASMFFPSLNGTAGIGGGAIAGVRVADDHQVGNYAVTVLNADNSDSLSAWLVANDLKPLDDAARPVVDEYAERGWCFVVARLARDRVGRAVPHPILARFASDAPVYPMKLTALADSTTHVELFVVADGQASAGGFHCSATDRFLPIQEWTSLGEREVQKYAAVETSMKIGQPDLVGMMWDGCVVTSLSSDMTPADMDKDIVLALGPVVAHRDSFHSTNGRRELVVATFLWGVTVVAFVVAVVFRWTRRFTRKRLTRVLAAVVLACVAAGIAYVTPTVVDSKQGTNSMLARVFTKANLSAAKEMAEDGIRTGQLSDSGGEAFVEFIETRFAEMHVENPYTGGPIRAERSPGNFGLASEDDKLYLCVYDESGAECRVRLPRANRDAQDDSQEKPMP